MSASDLAPPAIDATGVLGLVSELHHELHPRTRSTPRRNLEIGLDSALDRELGFDSVTRLELVGRAERRFGVHLGEAAIAGVETPRQLLAVLAEAGPGARPGLGGETATVLAPEPPGPTVADRFEPPPARLGTLVEVLAWHAERHPERCHITFLPADGEPQQLTYSGLLARSRAICAGLQAAGVEPGDRVGLMLPSGLDYFALFFGALWGGAVPVPLYPPARPSQLEEHLRRQAKILATAEAKLLVAFPEAMAPARLVRGLVPSLAGVSSVAELEAAGGAPAAAAVRPSVRGGDLAFLQFTSGSTSDPKGVMLTHANLLANLRAIGEALELSSDDRVVSWLPLYHDMGLIGAWMGSLFHGMPLFLMSPLTFLARPIRWLRAIQEHRGTLAAAPNFAYELCLHRIADDELAGLDLSSWRAALNGAEPVSPDTLERFTDRYRAHGFRPGTLLPVYGLAECSLAVAFPRWGEGGRVDVIDREKMARRREATPVGPGDGPPDRAALRIVSCGQPLPRHEIRIADDSGRELGERHQGRLQFRGPSATSGYFRHPEATARLVQGDWLDSGDLGYVAEGELFVTGRSKDMILRAGRNIYPQELEEAVGALDGVRTGCVAVFGTPSPETGTERLVVMAETRLQAESDRQRLDAAIQGVIVELAGSPADEVWLVPPRTVPKTSSGKLRRAASQELYQSGRPASRGPVWWQVARLALAGLGPRTARAGRSAREVLHAGRFWAVVGLALLPVGLALTLLPSLRRRRQIARGAARQAARLASTPIRVEGLEHLEHRGPWIVTANHASYLDGFALTAALPVEGAFLAKKELRDSPLARLLLERLGTLFVERFDPDRGLDDLGRAMVALERGESLLFFPEGTFDRAPGLRAFRLGAFFLAARTGVPIVPVAIRGSRSILRALNWFPRKGTIRVTIRPPIAPDGDDWAAAVRLRDRTRAELLAYCDEPDRGGEAGGAFAAPSTSSDPDPDRALGNSPDA
jgi:1-acyl-sn-glycerol-3-phosphate acyltransferase